MTGPTDSATVVVSRTARRRNVLLLALCQAFFMTSTSAIVTSAALIGHSLSDDKALATLPLAMQFIAVMVVTAPASFLMKRIGRRDGFTVGLCIGLVGVALAVIAIRNSDFVLFCVASLLVGVFNGFGQYLCCELERGSCRRVTGGPPPTQRKKPSKAAPYPW